MRKYEDVRLNSADGRTELPIQCQPTVSFLSGFAGWNSPPGSGYWPIRARFFFAPSAEGIQSAFGIGSVILRILT